MTKKSARSILHGTFLFVLLNLNSIIFDLRNCVFSPLLAKQQIRREKANTALAEGQTSGAATVGQSSTPLSPEDQLVQDMLASASQSANDREVL